MDERKRFRRSDEGERIKTRKSVKGKKEGSKSKEKR
jgi:hypothetical protein